MPMGPASSSAESMGVLARVTLGGVPTARYDVLSGMLRCNKLGRGVVRLCLELMITSGLEEGRGDSVDWLHCISMLHTKLSAAQHAQHDHAMCSVRMSRRHRYQRWRSKRVRSD